MNLIKSIDYFNPEDVKSRCHIIGCGSVGSTVAELLARLGVTKISLYDFDTVSSHNLANQMFFDMDVGRKKVDAVKEMICKINPSAERNINIYEEGWVSGETRLSGYVFLCVDNIDVRREIATENRSNFSIKAFFDFRTRLEDAQHYAALWSDPKQQENFIKTMDFTHEEAKSASPVTACNVEIGVSPTVRIICSYGIANFMNLIRGKGLKTLILADAFGFDVDSI